MRVHKALSHLKLSILGDICWYCFTSHRSLRWITSRPMMRPRDSIALIFIDFHWFFTLFDSNRPYSSLIDLFWWRNEPNTRQLKINQVFSYSITPIWDVQQKLYKPIQTSISILKYLKKEPKLTLWTKNHQKKLTFLYRHIGMQGMQNIRTCIQTPLWKYEFPAI